MPRFLVLKDTALPPEVYGPKTLRAGQVITVSGDEAPHLIDRPDEYKSLDWMGATRVGMITQVDVTKSADAEEETVTTED
jgi:hypothetical protein